MIKNILYLSYDGILEPIGYANVYQYLKKLSSHFCVVLITFEKKKDKKNEAHFEKMKQACIEHNMVWISMTYHKAPALLATLYDLIRLWGVVFWLMLVKPIHIIHLRGYVAGAILPLIKPFFKVKLIFDMRGFWADEKHDRAGWPKSSPVYKLFKRLECWLMSHADCIVSLTQHAKTIIEDQFVGRAIQAKIGHQNGVQVIRTCTDLDIFYPNKKRQSRKFQDGLVFGYLGSIDTAYQFKDVLTFFKQMLGFNPNHQLHVLTRSNMSQYDALIAQLNIPKKGNIG